MHPLSRDRAVAFWHGVAAGVAAGKRALLVSEDERGVCGTVSWWSTYPRTNRTGPIWRRCWCIAGHRRQGLGSALMRAAESRLAANAARPSLVLDAVTDGDAALCTPRLGWLRVATSLATPSGRKAGSAAPQCFIGCWRTDSSPCSRTRRPGRWSRSCRSIRRIKPPVRRWCCTVVPEKKHVNKLAGRFHFVL